MTREEKLSAMNVIITALLDDSMYIVCKGLAACDAMPEEDERDEVLWRLIDELITRCCVHHDVYKKLSDRRTYKFSLEIGLWRVDLHDLMLVEHHDGVICGCFTVIATLTINEEDSFIISSPYELIDENNRSLYGENGLHSETVIRYNTFGATSSYSLPFYNGIWQRMMLNPHNLSRDIWL